MSEFLSSQEIDSFSSLIEHYQMNEEAKAEFLKSNFAVIAGPTGAGKDTLRNLLVEDYPEKYAPILSTTSRAPRIGERDGIDYHFRSKQQIQESLENGEFFESAIVHNQQVSCLHINEITKLNPGQVGLSILIVQTEHSMRQVKPDIKTIFIVPPTLTELKRRMAESRNLSAEEVARRLDAAKKELEFARDRPEYYCLVNDQLVQALRLSRDFFENGQRDEEKDKIARDTINLMIKDL